MAHYVNTAASTKKVLITSTLNFLIAIKKNRLFFALAVFLLFNFSDANAATYYYIGVATNTSDNFLNVFTKANTWSLSSNGSAVTPSGTAHTYIFDGAGGRTNVVVDFTSGQAYSTFSGQIQVTGNTSVTFQDGGGTNRTLSFGGSLAGDDLVVDAGSTFYLARRIGLTLTNSASITALINGTLKIGTNIGTATLTTQYTTSTQLTVNGKLDIVDNGGISFANNSVSFGGSAIIDLTGTVQNTAFTSINFGSLINNAANRPVNIYNSGGVRLLNTTMGLNAGKTINIKSGGVFQLHTNVTTTYTFTNSGTFVVEAGGTFERDRSVFTNSGTYTLQSGGIIKYVFVSAGNANATVGAEWPTTLPNGCKIINAMNNATYGVTWAGTRTISQNSTVEVVGISRWMNGGLGYNSTGTTLIYSGTNARTIDATREWPASNGPVNVEVNNSGGVTLPASSNRTIAGTLTLTSGRLTLGANNLLLSSATGLSGGSASSYIETNSTGLFQRIIGAAGTYNFPLGSSTAYNPASVVWAAAPGVTRLDARYISSTASAGTGLPASFSGFTVNSLLDNGYWDIAVGAGAISNNYNITLTRNGHANAGLNLNNHGIVKRDNSSSAWAGAGTWTDPGATLISPASSGQVSITQTGINSFSEFAIGEGTGGCASPSTQATSFTSNTITATTGNVAFTRGNGTGGVLVVARAGGAVNADPVSGSSYTASSTFGSGQQIGTGNFVVYNGTAAGINTASGNIAVSGLSAVTTYHFAVYEYNSTGVCYNTTKLTGSFTTNCSTPINVTGLAATVDNQQSAISWTNSACYDEVMIVAKAGSSVSGTPTGNGSAYTANLAFGSGTAFGGGFVVYKGDVSPQTITGLVNGTTYFVKVFTRKGTNWSSGVEVSVVPIPYYQAGLTTGTMDLWPQANPFWNSAGTLEDFRVGTWYTQAQFGLNGTIAIDRIGWFIKQATGSAGNYQNFNIKLKSTSQACTSTFQTGTTTVSTSATVTINSSNQQEAWLELVLATPFVWNAGDYLYVETCYDNPNGGPVGNNNIIVAGFSTNTTGFVRSAGGTNINGCTQSVSTSVCLGQNVPSLRIAGEVCTNNTWTAGATNIVDKTKWFDKNNWSCGIVPTSGVDVVIPTTPIGGNYYPIVDGIQTASVRDITISPSATMTFSSAATLVVNGDFTNNGTVNFETGELQMQGSNKTLNGNFNLGILNIQGNTAINAGGQVNVLDKLELQAGQLNTNNKLTLKSSAAKTAFVDDFSSGFNGTVTGDLSIERYVPGSGNKFHYFGALSGGTAIKWNDDYTITSNAADNTAVTLDPSKPCGPTALAVGSAYGNLLTYDETLVTNCFLKGWRVRNTSAATARGRGFAGRVPSTTVLTETGTYAKTDVTLSGLTVTGANTDATSKGFHFVSNPFWAPILWSQVTGSNLYGTAYRYDPNTGSYGAYNNITAPMEISTNEAFFVRGNWATVNDGNSTFSITFPATARTTGENNTFLRSGLPYAYGVKITVNAHNTTDHTLIAFDNRFTTAHDNGYDALKLDNDFNVANIYTIDATAQRSAILALPENTATASVPLNIDIRYTDVHNLTFDLQSFPSTAMVFLEDKTTGVWHNLRVNNTYSFNATIGDNSDRFVLHFTPAAVFNATASGCENNTGIISIQQDGGIMWDYEIKDQQNTTVLSGSNLTGYIEFTQLAAGNYTIALVHESGYTATENIAVIATENISLTVNTTANTLFVNEPVTVNAVLSSNGTTNWNMGDGTVYNNTETVTHSYTIAGSYTVSATAANDNCNDTKTIDITVEENLVTGIAAKNDKSLKVFASGNTVFVEQYISKEVVSAELTLYNTIGQIIQQEKMSELNYGAKQQINVNASSGIYYLHIVLSNGTETQTKLLINR